MAILPKLAPSSTSSHSLRPNQPSTGVRGSQATSRLLSSSVPIRIGSMRAKACTLRPNAPLRGEPAPAPSMSGPAPLRFFIGSIFIRILQEAAPGPPSRPLTPASRPPASATRLQVAEVAQASGESTAEACHPSVNSGRCLPSRLPFPPWNAELRLSLRGPDRSCTLAR